MEIVCVSTTGLDKSELTLGKIYDVRTWEDSRWGNPRYYVVMNNFNIVSRYDSDYFDTLDNVREAKLNELGI